MYYYKDTEITPKKSVGNLKKEQKRRFLRISLLQAHPKTYQFTVVFTDSHCLTIFTTFIAAETGKSKMFHHSYLSLMPHTPQGQKVEMVSLLFSDASTRQSLFQLYRSSSFCELTISDYTTLLSLQQTPNFPITTINQLVINH